MASTILYGYFRSSAAWRVRIALALKGVAYDQHSVHLVRDGGEQHAAAYKAKNPSALVPYFKDDRVGLGQSLAILEYLDERYPEPPLLPADPAGRAKAREIAQAIASDIHPLNNLRVLQYLTGPLGHSEDEKLTWYRHWIAVGLATVEALLPENTLARGYCCGDGITMADICLVPQIYNARRFECALEDYPRIRAVESRLSGLPAFAGTAPETQPDAG